MRPKEPFKFVLLFTMTGLMFFMLFCQPQTTFAQKKPTEFDSRLDDKGLCTGNGSLRPTEYCDFWTIYRDNRTGNPDQQRIAADARDELIKCVRGRVDRFFPRQKFLALSSPTLS